MNTRQAIQPSTTPLVLSISYSPTLSRICAGLSTGLRVLRTDNCLPTYTPSILDPDLPFSGGIAIAEALDDRYIAFVSGGRAPAGKDSVVVFWDCVLGREVQRLEFGEQVKGVRVSGRWMVVVLLGRSVVFGYRELRQEATPPPDDGENDEDDGDERKLRGPNKIHALHPTSENPYALASLRNDLLILPAQSVGQIQLIPLPSGAKRVLRAHNTALRCIALSPSGNLLATASQQGTLIRVFNTNTLEQIAEFRRGVEKAIVYSLAFSDGERWLACTSDKGTIHVFDLRPPPSEPLNCPHQTSKPQSQRLTSSSIPAQPHRKSSSHSQPPLHLSPTSPPSIHSSPSTATATTAFQGSIQEYYGLRPPPLSTSHPPALTTTMQALKASPWAPKVLKDVRSVASAPFMMGQEGAYWQLGGGASHSWTTGPDGTRRRVRNAVPGLPGEPEGRAVKGIVAFAPRANAHAAEEDEGALLYIVGGGLEGRWECFDLVGREGGGWALVRRGWRAWLGRVFVE